jgi:hypothetical protein
VHEVLTILLYLALGATVITLVIGVAAMFRGDNKAREDSSNRLMRMRVIFQALALAVLALLLYTSRH